VSLSRGPIEILAGRPDDAARELQAAYDTLKGMGEQNFITTVGAYLAEAVRRQGRLDAALELAAEAAAGAAEDDVPTQVAWRSARAKALLDPSTTEEAARLAAEAVALADGTDDLAMQGDALLDEAEVLARQGEVERAGMSANGALERYRAKQHRVGERLALEALSALGATVSLSPS